MENENYSITKMIKEFILDARQVKDDILIKIVKDAKKKAGGKIRIVELPNKDELDERLRKLLPKEWMNGHQAFAQGSPSPAENKNLNFRLTWLAAYVLAMQDQEVKR